MHLPQPGQHERLPASGVLAGFCRACTGGINPGTSGSAIRSPKANPRTRRAGRGDVPRHRQRVEIFVRILNHVRSREGDLHLLQVGLRMLRCGIGPGTVTLCVFVQETHRITLIRTTTTTIATSCSRVKALRDGHRRGFGSIITLIEKRISAFLQCGISTKQAAQAFSHRNQRKRRL